MIRKALAGDIAGIERVMQASMTALGSAWYDPVQVASAVRFIAIADPQLVEDQTYFVAEEAGRIVACGGWSFRTKLFSGPASEQRAGEGLGSVDPTAHPARIRAMFVDPVAARRGLGRRILAESEEDAIASGFTRFELMATLPGVPLYRICGYEEIERPLIELPDGVLLECVRMVKQARTPAQSGHPAVQ